MWLAIQGGHFSVADFLPFRVRARLKDCLDHQSSRGPCSTDESQQRVPGSQWYSGPIAADLAKQSVLNGIPFRTSGRIVAHGHGQAEPIANLYLQAFFPRANAAPVAATRVSQHQELIAAEREAGSAFGLPPRGNGIDGERLRVTRRAKIDEAAVFR